MNKYELTIVLPGKASAAKEKKVKEIIEKLVKVFKGKVEKLDKWGEIELAYKIQKEGKGDFLHFNLELPGNAATEINKKLKLEDDIIRYLLVRKGG